MNLNMSQDKPQPHSFASRTIPFQESVIREMTRLGDETGSVNLSQGLPDFDPPPEVLEAAVSAIQSGDNQYTFPFGSQAFRQAIAAKSLAYNHIPVDPETDITVTCGVSEALMATVFALTDPGDEVILFQPYYENYLPACHLAGVIPRFVAMHQPDYNIDMDELRQAFNNKTRLIIINTPHNPTGRVLSRLELEGIAALCQEYGAIAVSDEIYERILYDGFSHVSLGSLEGMQELTVTVSGLGKTYAVTGWRVGWEVAHASLSALIRKVHDYMTVCAPAPFQAAGIVALGLPESYYTSMRAQYQSRRKLLLAALDASGFSYHTPEGAYYVMADYSRLNWDQTRYSQPGWTRDRTFAEYMARQTGVAVVPGSSFYTSSDDGITRVRFNFAKREETLYEAARRLALLMA
jgi:aspartate/methionine/tyrosine aminotransferase